VITPARLPRPSAFDVSRRVALALGSASRHLMVARRRGGLDQDARAWVIRRTFDDLGGTFTKLGQLIASSPGLFGDDVAAEFRGCLDRGPAVPFRTLRRAIEKDLGRSLHEMYADFDRTPLAAASLAVVHRATLLDGTPVAVKVLRPGIKRSLATDLATLRPLADFVGKQVAVGIAGTLPGLIRGLGDQIAEEVDLTNEARSIHWFRSLLDSIGADMIRIPEPIDELCGKRVLTMELVEGVAVDDDEGIAELGVDPRPALRECLRAWFAGLLVVGAFHGDIHAGNLLICPDGKMGVLDWGIVGRVDADTGQFLRRLLEAALGDETAWPDVARYIESQYGAGLATSMGLDEDGWVAFIRSYLEPMLSSPIGEVDLRTMLIGAGIADGVVADGSERDGWRDNLQYWWEERRRQRILMASEGFGGGFDRSTFLLGKQLVYFERYGKRYLPDVPLIDDPEAYRALLDAVTTIEVTATAPSEDTLGAASALLHADGPDDDDGVLAGAGA
jgi:predicted unusual protein kinase regulating ubiquinone biosynthesis (AarF/ABC1/UbiB family)